MKNFKKLKTGLNDEILDFEGRSPVRTTNNEKNES